MLLADNSVGLKVQQPEQRKSASLADSLILRDTDANVFLPSPVLEPMPNDCQANVLTTDTVSIGLFMSNFF